MTASWDREWEIEEELQNLKLVCHLANNAISWKHLPEAQRNKDYILHYCLQRAPDHVEILISDKILSTCEEMN